jgi:hypothetical protein
MKTYIFLISLLIASALSVSASYAQQQDSLKQKQVQYFSKVLKTGQDTAKLVSVIMDTYKESVKKVIAEAAISEDVKRVKIDGLIAEKNQKLALILSPAQQAIVIPSTERKQNQTVK